MLRVVEVRASGAWGQGPHETCAPDDVVVLDFDARHRRRIVMTGVRGLSFLLDLPKARHLRSGEALLLDDGRLVEVLAAPEPLLELSCVDAHQTIRLAWHLGNRHLPTQIVGKKLRIRQDHVIADMARGLGAIVRDIQAPFDPEGGAYENGGHGHHHHDHGDHDHHHHHAHRHGGE